MDTHDGGRSAADQPGEPAGDQPGNRAADKAGNQGDATKPGKGPKPPPWQVPQPELRPELLDQAATAPSPGPGPAEAGPTAVFDPFERDRERAAAARKKRSQRRTVVVGLGVTALLAGTITAMVSSGGDDADYAQVCFNDETGERVDDSQCGNSSTAGRSSGIYAWYFYSRGASVPGIGQNRSAYPSFSKTVPSGAKASTGYSSKGGTVSRGGFGGSAKGGSTGG